MSRTQAKAPGRPAQSRDSGEGTASQHNSTDTVHTSTPVTRQPQALWNHIYGDSPGYISLFSGFRVDGQRDLQKPHVRHYVWPAEAGKAVTWLERNADSGREVYMCAHLIRRDGNTQPQRKKEQAAPVRALYVDADGAQVPDSLPPPTAVVRSSPGRDQFWWQLTHSIEPARAEALNKRLAYGLGADKSGWDLTQLLRVPGTPNRKYPGAPAVQLAMIDDNQAYDPDELERTLPEAPASDTVTSFATSPDDPPVRLDDRAMDWWTGRVKDDDRSDTLWGIAKDLARAGAMPHTIAAAIQNRDETFYPDDPKYAGRPEKYLETAINATKQVLASPTPAESRASATIEACAGCDDLKVKVERLQERVRTLRDENEQIKEDRRIMLGVLRNRALKAAEAMTALAVTFDLHSGESRKVDSDGWLKVSLDAIAENAGCSKSTASRHIGKLEEWGIVEKNVIRHAPGWINPATGEILEDYSSEMHLKLSTNPRDTLKHLVEIEPARTATHGGYHPKKRSCPDHPHADLHVTKACTECGTIVDEYTEDIDGNTQEVRNLPVFTFSPVASCNESPEADSCGQGTNRGQLATEPPSHDATAVQAQMEIPRRHAPTVVWGQGD